MTLRSSGPRAAESSDGTALGAVMIGAFYAYLPALIALVAAALIGRRRVGPLAREGRSAAHRDPGPDDLPRTAVQTMTVRMPRRYAQFVALGARRVRRHNDAGELPIRRRRSIAG